MICFEFLLYRYIATQIYYVLPLASACG
jgi:hypothetical protein